MAKKQGPEDRVQCGWMGNLDQGQAETIAWEMVKELASGKTQLQAAELGTAIPARRTVAKSPEFLVQPQHAALFYQSLSYAAPIQAPANYSEVAMILLQHLGRVMVDEAKPEDALREADQELTAALKQQAAEGH